MFSKENGRYRWLVVLMISIAVGTIVSVTVLIVTGHSRDSALVTGFAGILIAQVLQMMRAETERKESHAAREEIKVQLEDAAQKVSEVERKTNGNLERAIEKVAEKVKQASDRPAPSQSAMPRDPAELEKFIEKVGGTMARRVAEDLCYDVATKAAKFAAIAVRDAERGGRPGEKCDHPNDPRAAFCSTCGIRLIQAEDCPPVPE